MGHYNLQLNCVHYHLATTIKELQLIIVLKYCL